MKPRASTGRPRVVAIAAIGMLGATLHVGAATTPPDAPATGDVYTCKTGNEVVKSDHEMTDCQGVQTRTNRAGVVTRMLTLEQIAFQNKCEKDRDELLTQWRTTDRYNKNLVGKYPDIAALRQGRDADLASARESAARSQSRLGELDKERKRLANEREFYPSGPLPQRLQRAIDDNDALITAQQQSLKTAQADVARIGANFDDLEKYMRTLWLRGGAPPPSIDCSPEKLFGPAPRR